MSRHPAAAAPPAAAGEQELKLKCPPRQLRRLLAHPLLRAASRRVRLEATYYDTPDLALWRGGAALRVRREGRRWVQTLKGGGGESAGLHSRFEFEADLPDGRPAPGLLPVHPQTRLPRSRKVAAALQPVLRTDIVRTLRLLRPAPGVLIEAAIDCGVIRSGRRSERICELELELKRGPATALFDLALRLAAVLPLTPEHRSKAERGYALRDPAIAAPRKAEAPRMSPAMSAGDALRAIMGSTLAQIGANAQGVLHGNDPEYLHQMRVGLRRLRSALDLHADALGEALAGERQALRGIAAGLGAARDWDVLVGECLPAMPVVPAALAAFCERERRHARTKAKSILKTNSYVLTLLTLGRWLADPQSTGAACWQQPARDSANGILAARHLRVLRRGRRLSRRSAGELHRLRIAVKKLRYATEFFADLFQVKAMRQQRRLLAELQDILGLINDAAAAEALFDGAGSRGRVLAKPAVQALLDWHRRRSAGQREGLAAAWRRFRAAAQPWQQSRRV